VVTQRRPRSSSSGSATCARTSPSRVVPIDGPITEEWGRIDAAGPRPVEDALMAATAIVHGMTFVTRDVAHVTGTGARVLNPWELPRA